MHPTVTGEVGTQFCIAVFSLTIHCLYWNCDRQEGMGQRERKKGHAQDEGKHSLRGYMEEEVHAAPELVKVQEEEAGVRQVGSPLCSLSRSGAPTGQG